MGDLRGSNEGGATPERLILGGVAAWLAAGGSVIVLSLLTHSAAMAPLMVLGFALGGVLVVMGLMAKAAQIGFRAAMREEDLRTAGTRRL